MVRSQGSRITAGIAGLLIAGTAAAGARVVWQFTASGARVRKKVSGKTKTEVRDKLRELHERVEGGLRPQRRYTVGDALEDWLTGGVDGLSA